MSDIPDITDWFVGEDNKETLLNNLTTIIELVDSNPKFSLGLFICKRSQIIEMLPDLLEAEITYISYAGQDELKTNVARLIKIIKDIPSVYLCPHCDCTCKDCECEFCDECEELTEDCECETCDVCNEKTEDCECEFCDKCEELTEDCECETCD